MPQAIDNINLLQLCFDCGAAGFVPSVAYAYDGSAKTMTITAGSTIPGGDTYLKTKVQVFDKFNGEVRGVNTVQATPLVIDVSTLNPAKLLDIKVTVLTAGKIAADGGAYNVSSGATGNLAQWDVQKN